MIRVFQMIFSPEGTWPKIAEKNRHFLFVLFVSTLPLMCVCLAAEGYGLQRWGESGGEFGRLKISQEQIVRFLGAQLAGDLIFLFLGSYFLLNLARSFNGRATFSQAFNTLAYGASPIFLLHAADGLPSIPNWICWAVGAALSCLSLYHGVAVNMKPEQTKGFGLYIVSIFVVGFLSGLAYFIALAVLHGKMLR
jgi:hypothetical protein